MFKLSPSSLGLYKDCPRCFWLAFVKDIKAPGSIFPSLPSGMDLLIKKHFDRHRALGQVPPELKKWKIKARLFDEMELLNAWRNNRRGIQWENDGVLLRGAVDEILVIDDKLAVLDFKTRGFPVKDDTHKYYIDQMNLYNLLLVKNGFSVFSDSFLLFYHPIEFREDGSVVFETTAKKIPVDVDSAETLVRNAVKCLRGKMPKRAECDCCDYREQ